MHMSEIHYSYFNTPVFPRNNEKCLSHLLRLKGVKRLVTNLDNEMLKCPKLVWPVATHFSHFMELGSFCGNHVLLMSLYKFEGQVVLLNHDII